MTREMAIEYFRTWGLHRERWDLQRSSDRSEQSNFPTAIQILLPRYICEGRVRVLVASEREARGAHFHTVITWVPMDALVLKKGTGGEE